MGERDGFEVVVVPPFDLDGRPVRSSEIRDLIRSGDLGGAAQLLGRPVTLTGTATDGQVAFELPMAVPPDGRYAVTVDGSRVGRRGRRAVRSRLPADAPRPHLGGVRRDAALPSPDAARAVACLGRDAGAVDSACSSTHGRRGRRLPGGRASRVVLVRRRARDGDPGRTRSSRPPIIWPRGYYLADQRRRRRDIRNERGNTVARTGDLVRLERRLHHGRRSVDDADGGDASRPRSHAVAAPADRRERPSQTPVHAQSCRFGLGLLPSVGHNRSQR